MDLRFGTWNVRSLYKVVSPMTVLKEVSKYKLDLIGMQVVRRVVASIRQVNTHFSMERGMRSMN
jgi:hypothetical protein